MGFFSSSRIADSIDQSHFDSFASETLLRSRFKESPSDLPVQVPAENRETSNHRSPQSRSNFSKDGEVNAWI